MAVMTTAKRIAGLMLLSAMLAVFTGCEHAKIVAIEIETSVSTNDTESESETLEDTGTGTDATENESDSPTDDTESDNATESETDSDTGEDTESETDTPLDTESETDSESELICASASTPITGQKYVTVGDRTRSYYLRVPGAYSGERPVPLILDFHTLANTGSQHSGISIFPGVTDPDGVIIAFPDGLDGPAGTAWNIGECCVNDLENVDDVAFAKAVVDDVSSMACINPSQVYAVGYIMGGGMAYEVACHAADVFAAVVSVGFDLVASQVTDCAPSRGISELSYRAVQDMMIPFNGGESQTVSIPGQPVTFLGAENTMKTWAELNDCTGTATDIGGGCSIYPSTQCRDGAEVMLCVDSVNFSASGDSVQAWNFLKQHTLE
jgi:polyhydroxybutyrate depolymerase